MLIKITLSRLGNRSNLVRNVRSRFYNEPNYATTRRRQRKIRDEIAPKPRIIYNHYGESTMTRRTIQLRTRSTNVQLTSHIRAHTVHTLPRSDMRFFPPPFPQVFLAGRAITLLVEIVTRFLRCQTRRSRVKGKVPTTP